ncbi:MAG TPA: Glu/Leu/Phe/Val dehydrogenase dimerization domain-containing protein [Caulobacteraceae bacterium]|jgi:leucine dehydrogenase
MPVFDSPAFEGHEGVHAFHDQASGLKAIVAIHSTARGPAAGGCRMWPYESDQAALDDALRLSRAMSYKNAVADLELGGGKSVIIGDSRTQKTPALFEALGEAIEALGGRYWGAEDVGVSPSDLTYTRRRTRYVAGLEGHDAASGDPSPVTAEGVFRGVALCVQRKLGRDLNGVRVAIQGVGNVGGGLADRLAAAGADLIITDANIALAQAVAKRTDAEVVAPGAIFDAEADVFAPCALGGAISVESLARIKARIIAGGANNQLANPEAGQALFEKGLLYAPDYVINGGGIINVAAEIRALDRGESYDRAWVDKKLARLTKTLDEILQRSIDERRPTHVIANEVAKARLEEGRLGKVAA